ncbi:SHOCT domain-containing protein [Ralstonia pickettii]|nr:SHOCT domain-containing protein [Ralstonia pickettii]
MPTEFIIRMALSAIVLIVLVIILIRFSGKNSKSSARDSLEIMKERYEKGELSKEDYEEAKRRRGKS